MCFVETIMYTGVVYSGTVDPLRRSSGIDARAPIKTRYNRENAWGFRLQYS